MCCLALSLDAVPGVWLVAPSLDAMPCVVWHFVLMLCIVWLVAPSMNTMSSIVWLVAPSLDAMPCVVWLVAPSMDTMLYIWLVAPSPNRPDITALVDWA